MQRIEAIAKIELLATVGWKQGCQPAFQLPILGKMYYALQKRFPSLLLQESVFLWKKPVSLQRSRRFGHAPVVVSKIVLRTISKLWIVSIDCALGCDM